MGLGDKIHNAAEKLHGKSKAAAGNATGNDRVKAEGKRHNQGRPEAGWRKNQRRLQETLRHAARRLRYGPDGPHLGQVLNICANVLGRLRQPERPDGNQTLPRRCPAMPGQGDAGPDNRGANVPPLS